MTDKEILEFFWDFVECEAPLEWTDDYCKKVHTTSDGRSALVETQLPEMEVRADGHTWEVGSARIDIEDRVVVLKVELNLDTGEDRSRVVMQSL